MEVLLIKANGYEEIVNDFTDFQRSVESNLASYQISFSLTLTKYNAFVFQLIQGDQVSLLLDGQEYVVQQINPVASGSVQTIAITATHIFYEIQRLIRLTDTLDSDYEDGSKPKHTLADYLQYLFAGDTGGYSYEIQGSFTQTVLITDFGNADGLSLLNTLIENFSCYIKADNKHLIIMDESQFKTITQNQFRSLFNTDNINLQIDKTGLRTKCWVYPYKDEYDNYYFDPYIYVSPNDGKYNAGFGDAVDLTGDEDATDKSYTDDQAAKALSDVPAITFSLDYQGDQVPDIGDVWRAVIEPMNLDTDVTIVGVVDNPFDPKQLPTLTFSNAKNDILSIQQGLANQVEQAQNQAIYALDQAKTLSGYALTTANGKNKNYYSELEPTGTIVEGDLWYKIVDGQYARMYRYDGIQWQLILNADTNDALNKANDALTAANGKNTVYHQAAQPIAGNNGDIWFHDNADGTITQFIYQDGQWVNPLDDSVKAAQDQAANAVNTAGSAITQAQTAINTANNAASVADNANQSVVTLTQTVNGLSTQVSNKVDTITFNSYTAQTAETIATLLTKDDAASTYATQSALTQTSSSLTSQITTVQNNLNNVINAGNNLVQDSGFESSKWSGTTTEQHHLGSKALKVTANGAVQDIDLLAGMKTSPGRVYYCEVWALAGQATWSGTANLAASLHNTQTGANSWPSIATPANNSLQTWTKLSGYLTVPDGYDQLSIRVSVRNDVAAGNVFYFDDAIVIDVTDSQNVNISTQSQITQLSTNINLRVQKNDVINQINVSTESILIAGQKVHITGQTTIDNAVIQSAMIAAVDAGKITTGFLDTNRLAAKSVTVDKLDVTNLAAISANLGTVTAGNITGVNITGATISGSQINGESITSGIISADRIAANSITSDKIKVGDFNNLIENPDFERDASGRFASYGWSGLWVASNPWTGSEPSGYSNPSKLVGQIGSQASGNADRWTGKLIPVSRSDEFFTSMDAKWNGVSNGRLVVLAHAYDANGNGLSSWLNGATSTHNTYWHHVEGTITVSDAPAETAYVMFGVSWQGSNSTSGDVVWVDNIMVRRKQKGELIVDGTIQGVSIVGSSFYQNANGYQTWLDSNGFHQHYNTSDVWIRNGYLQASDTYGNYTDVQPFDGVRVHGEDGNESHMGSTVVETSGTMYSQHGFVNTSRVELKTDITALDDNIGLSLINSLDVYKFKYKSQIESGQIKEIYGAIIGEDYNLPDEFIDYNRQGVNLYSSIFIAIKSIQELTKLHQEDVLKIANLETIISSQQQQINDLMQQSNDLRDRVQLLEAA